MSHLIADDDGGFLPAKEGVEHQLKVNLERRPPSGDLKLLRQHSAPSSPAPPLRAWPSEEELCVYASNGDVDAFRKGLKARGGKIRPTQLAWGLFRAIGMGEVGIVQAFFEYTLMDPNAEIFGAVSLESGSILFQAVRLIGLRQNSKSVVRWLLESYPRFIRRSIAAQLREISRRFLEPLPGALCGLIASYAWTEVTRSSVKDSVAFLERSAWKTSESIDMLGEKNELSPHDQKMLDMFLEEVAMYTELDAICLPFLNQDHSEAEFSKPERSTVTSAFSFQTKALDDTELTNRIDRDRTTEHANLRT